MKNIKKGIRFELKVKRLLEKEGWHVIRTHRSRPIDLIAIKNGQILLIECKAGKWLTPVQQNKIQRLASKWQHPITIYRETNGKIYSWEVQP